MKIDAVSDAANVVAKPPDAPRTDLRRYMVLVGAGYLILNLADTNLGIGKLPLLFLLKNRLHLSAAAVAGFLAIISFAWYLKPLAGILSDNIPLFGTRRRHYLLLSTVVGSGLWLLLNIVPRAYAPLVWMLIVLNIVLMLAQATLGGLMVEYGKSHHATGRLSSQRVAAESLAGLIAGPVGGLLAARVFGLTIGINVALLLTLSLLFLLLAREERPVCSSVPSGITPWGQVKILFHSGAMWGAAGLWFLIRFSPGLQTALFYYQTNTLKFSPEFIGMLAVVNGGLSLLGCLFYARACMRLYLRPLLIIGIVINILVALAYLAYRSRESALVIEGFAGLAGTLAFMPLLDLLARATPNGSEAMGYALICSIGNISGSVSDVFGSWMYDRFHQNFIQLVWFNAGTTVLALFAVPFISRTLTDRRDGESTVQRDTPY